MTDYRVADKLDELTKQVRRVADLMELRAAIGLHSMVVGDLKKAQYLYDLSWAESPLTMERAFLAELRTVQTESDTGSTRPGTSGG